MVDHTVTLQTDIRDIVTGHPFSGVEERHSLQILGDGTRIETKSADKYYRDEQGRTRIEREDGTVLISDPVLGAGVEMKDGKVIRRSTFTHNAKVGYDFSSTTEPGAQVQKLCKEQVEAQAKAMLDMNQAQLREAKLRAAQITRGDAAKKAAATRKTSAMQAYGGIDAQGTRSITTIAAGRSATTAPSTSSPNAGSRPICR